MKIIFLLILSSLSFARVANNAYRMPSSGSNTPSWGPINLADGVNGVIGKLGIANLTIPTIQKFLSGSGTYTRPSSPTPIYLRVTMAGGGGGGGGSGISSSRTGGNPGGSGTNTTFGTTLLIANGATAPSNGYAGGTGGSFTINSPAFGYGITGGGGGGGGDTWVGFGGNNPLGGAGGTPIGAPAVGFDATANTGGGGGGGCADFNGGVIAGGGGGAGGYIEAYIPSPSATYSYSVGSGGGAGGGTGGGNARAGGAGGSGIIIIEEYYQ